MLWGHGTRVQAASEFRVGCGCGFKAYGPGFLGRVCGVGLGISSPRMCGMLLAIYRGLVDKNPNLYSGTLPDSMLGFLR